MLTPQRQMIVFPALLSAAAGLASAEELPTYTIQRAGTPISVDGRLDEPAWLAAPDAGSFQFPWWESGKKEQTVAKLLYDDRTSTSPTSARTRTSRRSTPSGTAPSTGTTAWSSSWLPIRSAPQPTSTSR